MKTILVDTREKPKAIKGILATLQKANVNVVSTKLYVGDYQVLDNPYLVIDRKNGLGEVCSNIIQDHKRFVAELERAKAIGIKVVVLITNDNNIKSLQDVAKWYNPRLRVNPKATKGITLMKAMYTIEKKYGCEFKFCPKEKTGTTILKILGVK